MPRRFVWIGALAVLGGAAGWFYYTTTPTYAIHQIEAAIETRNRLKFQRYVDVDRLAGSFIDGAIGRAVEQAGAEAGGFAALGAMVGASMVESMRPSMVSQLRSSILTAVENGRMDQIFGRRDTSTANLTLLSQRAAVDPVGFIGTTTLTREGTLATLGLRLRDRLLDTTLVLRVRLDRGNGGWQVTGLDDFPGYLAEVDRLQQVRLSRVNNQLSAGMKRHVRLERLTRTAHEIGYSTYLTIQLAFTNTGPDTITSAAARLQNVRGLDITDNDSWLVFSGVLAPRQRGTMKRIHSFNEFIDWHKSLRYGQGIVAEVFLLARRRGTWADTAVLHTSWADYVSGLR